MLILWWVLKIVGVITEYKEALDIEEIVKVFVIEQRISNLFCKKNEFLDDVNSSVMILSKNDVKSVETSSEDTFHNKNNSSSPPLFNVRGFN